MSNDLRDDLIEPVLPGPINARPAADEAGAAPDLLDEHDDPLAETDPTETDPTSAPTGRRHEPSNPSVTPTPADPWSDRQIFSTITASTVAGTIVGLLILRWFWKRWLWKRHRRLAKRLAGG